MSADTSTPLDSLCDAFDVAWQGPTPPALDDYVPAAGAAGREEALFALVRIDLERRTKSRERIRVEHYLQRFPELNGNVENVAALVLLEYDLRRRLEPQMEPAEFLGRFPILADRLRQQMTLVPGGGATADSPEEWELDLRDYVLLDCVGRGGMGEVYRGRDPALGRNLAVKVLRPELSGQTAAERRFEREARINGVLQHPSIVPVYNLGRLPDGRLYFTMKLVRGQTLADRLRAGGSGSAWLSDLLNIYEKICQAVAYAHSRGVIHRDLKPGNIMLGAFGEVQVMDWGVAKVLQRQAPGPQVENTISAITRSTQSGSTAEDEPTGVVGTTPYMAPEQAQGLSELMDERTDVFGLGAILCAILTGKPPHTGPINEAMLRRAAAGDLAEAHTRVERCGADAELVALCRECLELARERRPRDAGVVAARVVAYQDAVQERLDKAKQEQAAAHARAEEEARMRRMVEDKAAMERQVRRLTIGLASLGLLLLIAIGVAWWQKQHESAEAEKRQLAAKDRQFKYLDKMTRQLRTAREMFDRARKDSRGNPKELAEALATFEQAGDLAELSDAPQQLRDEALAMIGDVGRELDAATKDYTLLAVLLEIHEAHKLSAKDEKGKVLPLPAPSADQQYRSAFRAWDPSILVTATVKGRSVEALDPEKAAARLKVRPPRVVEEASAAFDEWACRLRRANRPEAEWRPLADLADNLADHRLSRPPNTRRLLRGNRTAKQWTALAGTWDTKNEPLLDTLLLAHSLEAVGEIEPAANLLAKARETHREEVLLHQALGKVRHEQQKWNEAIACYQEAHKLHPELGAALADALVASGQPEEALEHFQRLLGLAEQKGNVWLHLRHANALASQGRWSEAKDAYKTVHDLRPDDAEIAELLKSVWTK